ncbi:MAG: SDR family NAD(P)-dependent oxidoreductase [Solirubrobacterales bacterium]
MLAPELLREGLLADLCVLVAGATEADAHFSPAVSEACAELGARVHTCGFDTTEEAVVDEIITAAVAELGSLDLLVLDSASLFDDGARSALRTCLDTTWNVTRAVVNRAFLPAGRAGRIVYVAPAPDAGEQADAARAGLENLSRTLSIEWARYGITTVTIAPGQATTTGEVAALTAYLASPAGAYFSGCLFDLRGP